MAFIHIALFKNSNMRRWTEDELFCLEQYIFDMYEYFQIDFKDVASYLNKHFNNRRTGPGCKMKYFKINK